MIGPFVGHAVVLLIYDAGLALVVWVSLWMCRDKKKDAPTPRASKSDALWMYGDKQEDTSAPTPRASKSDALWMYGDKQEDTSSPIGVPLAIERFND